MRPDPTQIIDLANAFYGSGILFAATDAGVFGAIGDQTRSAAEIAGATGNDPHAMRLLLDACSALGLVIKDEDRYRNTDSSRMFLVEDSPASLVAALRYNRDVIPAWTMLPRFIQTGHPVERPELHLGEDAERTRTFVLSMHGKAMGIGRAAMASLDLRGRRRLLDVGGGPGTYSVLISQAYPDIECTVLDLPAVVGVAQELIDRANAGARVKTLPGDYHSTSFPPDLDVVLFFGMLHQESPESIIDLLRRAWQSLNPGGIVYVLDLMTDRTRAQPRFSALFAVNMALTTRHGWVFSDQDLHNWFRQCGFENSCVRPLPPPMPHWIASATKPGVTA